MAKASGLIVHPATWHTQTFTASGTFTVPDRVEVIYVTGCGGGGGGASGNTGTSSYVYKSSGGAGAGGIVQKPMTVTPGQSLGITIGSGGPAGAVPNSGSNGGDTIIGALAIAGGGGGNRANSSNVTAPSSPGGFQTDPSASGVVAPMHYILGAGSGSKCGVFSPNPAVNSTQQYSASGLSGGAGPYGNGGAGGGDTGNTSGAAGGANTGAGGGAGATMSSGGHPGGTGGSGYVFIEWLI